MRSVIVLDAAGAEAEEAAAWYEAQRPGLGVELRQELKLALDALREDLLTARPWPGRLGERGVKRISLKRFPFNIVFVASNTTATVLAVAHHRKRPAYWRDRLS